MFKLLRYISIFLITTFLLFACHGSTPVEIKRPPLKVAFINFIGYNPAIIAQEKGFFRANGVEVELKYNLKSAQLHQADFSAGKSDGIGVTLGTLMSLSATTPDMQAVLIADETNGADVVVAKPDIKTVADLKGKKLGAILGSFSEVFVTEMLKSANLTSNDVNLVKFDAVEIPKYFKNNTIQAGHTWEPYLSEVKKSGANVLFTSKQTPGLILDLVAFRGETIRDRPEDIRAFVQAWLQAVTYWEANVQEGNAIISKKLNIPINTLSFEGINLTDLGENQKLFQSNGSNSIYKTAKLYADFFIDAGNVTRIPDIKSLFNSSFLN
jgi:NitT/TauT family transport system substrate-binding protein